MKKKNISHETISRPASIIIGAAVVFAATWFGLRMINVGSDAPDIKFPDSKYGNFLALHHAVYVDDYDAVIDLVAPLTEETANIVQTSRATALFLAGIADDSAAVLAKDKNMTAQVAHAAHLINNDDWAGVYAKFKNNDSQIMSPIRIWSAVAMGREKDALKFIEKLGADDVWRSFRRGMVYAETGKLELAQKEFGRVPADFMNLNDYIYVMSFYEKAGFFEDFEDLHTEFTMRPAGMHLRGFKDFGDFNRFSGPKNQMAFGLIQSVSHSPILGMSGMALLLLRASAAIGGENDAWNYYMGMFFYNAESDKYIQYFDSIEQGSVFAPFAQLKIAEKAGNFKKMQSKMERILDENPEFLPALDKLISINMRFGREKAAFRLINNALGVKDLGDSARAHFLTIRAGLYRRTGDLNRAADDITHAMDIATGNVYTLSEQAKIWILRDENIRDAYDIALAMVANYPSDTDAWTVLAMAVDKREGPDAALEILERVARVAHTNSYLFENLGDIYVKVRKFSPARDAYLRALELSDDGLTSESKLKSKIRKLK